jgi:hypothetical protein
MKPLFRGRMKAEVSDSDPPVATRTPTQKRPLRKSLYSVHPSIAYAKSVLANLSKTTGKSMDDWTRIIKKSGPADDKACYEWLKKEHKLGGTTAWMVAQQAFGKSSEDTDPNAYLRSAPQWVQAMYAGPKSALRPIHDALIKLGQSMGGDVKVCPCKTVVPLYRSHVFAQVKPTTQTRIDFGLALKGAKKKPPKRLIDTGGLQKGDRITHRIPITSLDEIDEQVQDWLRIAYDLDEEMK